jgi:hypothetical protein
LKKFARQGDVLAAPFNGCAGRTLKANNGVRETFNE